MMMMMMVVVMMMMTTIMMMTVMMTTMMMEMIDDIGQDDGQVWQLASCPKVLSRPESQLAEPHNQYVSTILISTCDQISILKHLNFDPHI